MLLINTESSSGKVANLSGFFLLLLKLPILVGIQVIGDDMPLNLLLDWFVLCRLQSGRSHYPGLHIGLHAAHLVVNFSRAEPGGRRVLLLLLRLLLAPSRVRF